ncbi:hypothetical protein C8F01DRAFT_1257543 [Mycena amicta]|nr:hypothetical protein C8F01DRAFT_1257543 [Mycena amicta]
MRPRITFLEPILPLSHMCDGCDTFLPACLACLACCCTASSSWPGARTPCQNILDCVTASCTCASSHSWRAFFTWCLCIKMQDDVNVPGDRRDAAAAPLISTSEPASTPGMSIAIPSS